MTEEEEAQLLEEEIRRELCGHAESLEAFMSLARERKFDEAGKQLEKIFDAAECDVCQEIISEVGQTLNETYERCQTGDCDGAMKALEEKVTETQDIFCPKA
jgi:hypothetical protein